MAPTSASTRMKYTTSGHSIIQAPRCVDAISTAFCCIMTHFLARAGLDARRVGMEAFGGRSVAADAAENHEAANRVAECRACKDIRRVMVGVGEAGEAHEYSERVRGNWHPAMLAIPPRNDGRHGESGDGVPRRKAAVHALNQAWAFRPTVSEIPVGRNIHRPLPVGNLLQRRC